MLRCLFLAVALGFPVTGLGDVSMGSSPSSAAGAAVTFEQYCNSLRVLHRNPEAGTAPSRSAAFFYWAEPSKVSGSLTTIFESSVWTSFRCDPKTKTVSAHRTDQRLYTRANGEIAALTVMQSSTFEQLDEQGKTAWKRTPEKVLATSLSEEELKDCVSGLATDSSMIVKADKVIYEPFILQDDSNEPGAQTCQLKSGGEFFPCIRTLFNEIELGSTVHRYVIRTVTRRIEADGSSTEVERTESTREIDAVPRPTN